jgi:hypothetical protein
MVILKDTCQKITNQVDAPANLPGLAGYEVLKLSGAHAHFR